MKYETTDKKVNIMVFKMAIDRNTTFIFLVLFMEYNYITIMYNLYFYRELGLKSKMYIFILVVSQNS